MPARCAEDTGPNGSCGANGASKDTPRRYFCTYFDSRYLSRGLALYRSLCRHVSDFELWVLCFDELAFEALARLRLPRVRLVSLEDFERGDVDLQRVKPTRSAVEYFFTCSPSWPLYLLRHYEHIDVLMYLDADLYFFSSPEPIYRELAHESLLITPHDFPEHLKVHEKFGRFNVGLMLFRNDESARSALSWWRERCLEWCFDRVEEARFADQKYLDQWPALFPHLKILASPAGAVGPWNWMNYEIVCHHGDILVNGEALITFHFQSLSLHLGHIYTTPPRGQKMPGRTRRSIFLPYVRDLATAERVAKHARAATGPLAPSRQRHSLRPRALVKVMRSGDVGIRIR